MFPPLLIKPKVVLFIVILSKFVFLIFAFVKLQFASEIFVKSHPSIVRLFILKVSMFNNILSLFLKLKSIKPSKPIELPSISRFVGNDVNVLRVFIRISLI